MTATFGAGVSTISSGDFQDATFSRDGAQLYAVSGNHLFVFSVATGEVLANYTIGTSLGAIAVSPDGQYLAIVEEEPAGGNATLYRVDVSSGAVSNVTVAGATALFDVAFLADGSVIVSQQATGALRVADLATGDSHIVSPDISGNAVVSVSADGTYALAQPRTYTWDINTYDATTGNGYGIRQIADPYAGAGLLPPDSGVGAVSPDGNLVIDGMRLNVYSRDLGTSFSLSDRYGYLADPRGLVFSPDGSSLYLAAPAGQIVQISTSTWTVTAAYDAGVRPAQPFDGLTGERTGYGDILTVSPDGQHLSVIGNDGIQIIDLSVAQSIAGEGDDVLTGMAVEYGFGGNDTLTGIEDSFLYGGEGNDTYYVNNEFTTVSEGSGEGHDVVHTTVSVTLSANVEDLVLDGTSDISGYGNQLGNRIFGNSADNSIVGDDGDDRLSGGSGNDLLVGGNGNDRIDGGSGIDFASYEGSSAPVVVDLSIAGAQDTGGAGIDTLINIEGLIGSEDADILRGNSAANMIDGSWGADTMAGRAGSDTYYVDDAGDIINENANEGIDSVYSSVSYALSANVENLALTGSYGIDGTGNQLNNVLTGNADSNALFGLSGADTLVGNGGNDILDGGSGGDVMRGGEGNDAYYVDSAHDDVIETTGQGTDTVHSAIAYALGANVENLILSGSSSINGTGNSLANAITGNAANNRLSGGAGADRLTAAAGNDILDGGTGDDVMRGGVGDDRYYVDSSADSVIENVGEGRDTVYSSVSFGLAANVEDLILNGTAANGTGNALDNRIVGNAASNILDAAAGADVMRGGLGDDIYYVDNSHDRVIENSGEGTDTVFSSVTYAIAGNVEDLRLTGTAFRANGNAMANHLVGTDGDNILNGAGGADVMRGGGGNDTYFVDNVGDTVIEGGGAGNDRVYTTVSYTAPSNVEDIFIRGAGSVDATGNSLDNSIRGNGASNVITGGAGLDRVTGGGGADTFVFHDGDFAGMGPGSADQIRDFSTLQGDQIDLTGVDADTLSDGDQAFAFIGNAAFHHVAGELRYQIVSGTTYVYGDTNGDGAADFMIRLDGNHTMSASDFGL